MAIEREAWLAEQKGIYGQFKTDMAKAVEEGMTPDPVLANQKGGFLLAFSPSSFSADLFTRFGEEANMVVPGMFMYNKPILHSMISDFLVADNFVPDVSSDEHDGLIRKISSVARTVSDAHVPVFVDYSAGFVFNGTTLILRGVPDIGYFYALENALGAAEIIDLPMRSPWGAHITCGRASEQIDPRQVKELAVLCQSDLARQVSTRHRFAAVSCGAFTSSKSEFRVRWLGDYPLYDD